MLMYRLKIFHTVPNTRIEEIFATVQCASRVYIISLSVARRVHGISCLLRDLLLTLHGSLLWQPSRYHHIAISLVHCTLHYLEVDRTIDMLQCNPVGLPYSVSWCWLFHVMIKCNNCSKRNLLTE
jgi:hypothetical protein